MSKIGEVLDAIRDLTLEERQLDTQLKEKVEQRRALERRVVRHLGDRTFARDGKLYRSDPKSEVIRLVKDVSPIDEDEDLPELE